MKALWDEVKLPNNNPSRLSERLEKSSAATLPPKIDG
jgi:hypothetical protein